MIKRLLLSSLVFNIGIMAGRFSGFAREAFIASTYGVSSEADIVILMLTVPDLLVNILMGGALGAVLVPEFTQKSTEKSRKLLYQSFLFFGLAFLVVTAGLYLQTGRLIELLAPGFIDTQKKQASIALGWVIWLIPLTVLAGVTTAYLHSKNKFMVAALGTLIINSAIICGLVIDDFGYSALFVVAFFVLLGGGARLFSQLLVIKPSWSPISSLHPFYLHRTILIRYGQAMLSGSVLLLFPVIARALASYQGAGSLALFNYATRLIEFPLVIAVTFLATVFFPRLSQSFSADLKLHRLLIMYGVQITLGLSLVAAVALMLVSGAYIQVVYGYGNMQASGLMQVNYLVSIGLLGLPLQGLSSFLTAVFNARKNTRTPLLINTLGLSVFLLVNDKAFFGQELDALIWGMIISYGLICILQLICLRIEELNWWSVLFNYTFLAGIVCAVSLLMYASQWLDQFNLSSWLSLALACFSALFSLCIMVLFNNDVRNFLKDKLSVK